VSEDFSVHGYGHSGVPQENGKRSPLVHILAVDCCDVTSLSFHPEYAERVCEAIMKAARAAKRNRHVSYKLQSVSDQL